MYVRALIIALFLVFPAHADRRQCLEAAIELGAPERFGHLREPLDEMKRLLHDLADKRYGDPAIEDAALARMRELMRKLPAGYLRVPMLSDYLTERKTKGMRYLSRAEQEERRIYVRNGKLYDAKGNLFDTSEASSSKLSGRRAAIVIMDEEGNFYSSNYHEKDVYHHTTLARGNPVAFAGEWEVKDGELRAAANVTGHYLNSVFYAVQFAHSLKKQGVPTDNAFFYLADFPVPVENGKPLTIAVP